MTKNSESYPSYPASKPTAPKQDGSSYSPFGGAEQEWDPTVPRQQQHYTAPTFGEAGMADYAASVYSADSEGQAPYPDGSTSANGIDTDAIFDFESNVEARAMPRAKRGTKMTRKEKKAAKRELARQKRELAAKQKESKAKAKSLKQQLAQRDKQLTDVMSKTVETRRKAKNVIDWLGYNNMYIDGICEVEEGLFSETIAFDDTSYQSTRDDIQKGIFAQLCRLYDQFGSNDLVQMNVINTPIPSNEIGSRQFFDPMAQNSEEAAEDAALFNEILNQKMRQGVSNIRRDRYLTFSVMADSLDEALPKLQRLENETQRILNTMNSSSHVLNGTERLEVINSQLNPLSPFFFDYRSDIGMRKGMTTKDVVAPQSLDWRPQASTNCFMTDGMYGQVLVMSKFGSELTDKALSDIVSLPIPLNATWYVQPWDKAKAIERSRTTEDWIDKETIDIQRKAANKGYDITLLPFYLRHSKAEIEEILDDLTNKNQRLYEFTGLVYTYAATKEQLDNQAMRIISTARQHSLEISLLPFQQPEGLNSVLPLGHNHVSNKRTMTTAQTAILMPFATQELNDEGGNYYGQNQSSSNLVFCNRKNLTSPMGFVCGKTGSGKGMFIKQEMTGTIFSNPEDEIFIIDRAGEYTEIARRYGGSVFDFAVNSQTYLNPLDVTSSSRQSMVEQVAFKVDAMLAQAGASATEAGNNLSEIEQSIIQRCVEEAFRRIEIKQAEKASRGEETEVESPLLQDFYDILLEQPEGEAHNIALRYERYVKGTMSFFNRHTNVDFNNRIIDFNLKELPDNMLTFALINVCEAVRNRMYYNASRNIRTWLYVEEMQSMFAYPTVLRYFSRFANEGRKFGMLLTGITQNAGAMLENEAARNIVTNADFLMLLKQSPLDRKQWIRLLNLSEQEEECIDESTEPGNGLLIAGAARVPIRGKFPKDNALYDLFSTNPEDKKEQEERIARFGK